jgi:hypothetical protein
MAKEEHGIPHFVLAYAAVVGLLLLGTLLG